MKIKLLSLVLGLCILLPNVYGQNYQGKEAERFIAGSEVVRFGGKSSIPEFIRLKSANQFAASKFPTWAKKAFELDERTGFTKVRDEVDELGVQHSRYQVTNNGIPVFGSFVYTHGTNDMVSSINGKIPVQIGSQPQAISEMEALEKAKAHVGAESYKWELQGEEDHLKWETEDPTATYFPKGELYYINPSFNYKEGDKFRLAYAFDVYAHQPVYRATVFVDAQSGEVLFENHRIHIADAVGTAQTGYSGTKSIVADSFGGGFRLREAGRGNGVRTFDMNEGTDYGNAVDFTDGNNVWNNVNANLDQYATDAHWGAEMTFDYYLDEHGRQSIDDNNMQINSYVHYDNAYFNAFWDGQRMTYGDGNNSPLTALDICGHEMTHGVTEFTAGLIYQDEYGALNESFSDIFGAAVEWVKNPSSGDWLMGEDVGTLRSMNNPNAYGDPDTYDGTNWYSGTADNGGVHTNSGVQNKWFVILTDGESGTNDLGDSYAVTGIGLTKSSAIAYRTLSVYLGATSEYVDARFYSIQAAADLYGACSPEVIATTNAWYAVGVGDEFDATVIGDFSASLTSSCQTPFTVEFTNLSSNGGAFSWDFGDGGTSTQVNPSHTYTSNGNYTVTLIVDGASCGTDTETRPNYISVDPNNPCVALMPGNGVGDVQTTCIGTLYDDGGPSSNYQDDDDVSITIAPPGASSVTLNFTSFAFEEGYDYLYVYDGPSTNSPLIGQYDGFNLPNGGSISSSGGSITIRQYSDIYVNEAGFALDWECVQPNSAPTPNFSGSPRISCDGQVSFVDMSINGATNWLWDFGDGNTSTQQNPTHTYSTEGDYTVTLTATNNFGNNVVSQNNYISVDRPPGPSALDQFRCDAGSVALSATDDGGTLLWYDQPSGGSSVGSGNTFNTPSLSATTSYYVEEVTPAASYNVGPVDNSFGGGSNFEGDQHLVFDCLSAFTLNTVKVYASGGKNRTIELRDNSGTVIQTLTTFIANGQQTVTLNFDVQPGNNYQLGTTTDPDLYRNNDSPSYPYTVTDVVSIETSSAGTDYYYFFYDWDISTPGCTTERTEVLAEVATAPSTQNASRCGTGSVNLSASGGGTLDWYDDPSGGSLVNTGTTFNTPSISSTTSYFVESNFQPAAVYGGATDNNFGTGSEFNNIQSLIFDCYQQVTLVSVKVYAFGAGNRTVELRNSGGTVLQSATINIPDGESRITLNFDLPIGTDLQLGTSAAPALYRNNSGPSYPYDIPGLLSITTSTAGNDFYYFFYDWEVQEDGCTTSRTEVVASIEPTPSVSVSGTTTVCEGSSVQLSAAGSNVDSYSWTPGGETSADITVSPTQQTTYTVTATNACGDVTDEVTVDVNPLPTLSAPSDDEICFGETVDLVAIGTGSLSWEPGGLSGGTISVSPQTNTVYTVTADNSCGSVSEDVTVTVNALPSANAGTDEEICDGESATLTASGGGSYSWNTGATGASITVSPTQNTSYTVQVTDGNNCSATDEVEVVVNPLPIADAGQDVEICVGESATLTASGGGSYSWSSGDNSASTSVTPTQTSTYTVTVTDGNGCSDSDDAEVTVNPLPNANAGADEEICEGESVTLMASGGGGYSWSSGDNTTETTVSPSQNTTYTVVVTDGNNCSDTDDVEVVVNALPTADAGQDVDICEGESTTLSASGGSSYLWDNAETTSEITVSPNSTQNYNVTVTNSAGCSDNASVTVSVNALPAQPVISANGSILESTTATSYQWYFNGVPIENATGSSYTPTQAGDYTVEIFDENGCSSVSEPYTWFAVGVDELDMSTMLFPNPTNGSVVVSSTERMQQIQIIDMLGKIVLTSYPNASRTSLDLSNIASGVYSLRMQIGNDHVTKQLIKTD